MLSPGSMTQPLTRAEEKEAATGSTRNLLVINQPHLQPGDILLYLPKSDGMTCSQKMICCMQALKKRKHGHQEVTHAAIFVHKKEKDQLLPRIADVTKLGFRFGKLKDDQPLLIFRSRNPDLARLINDEALSVNGNLRWSCCVALGQMCHRHKGGDERKLSDITISRNTTCSRLAIQILDRALSQIENKAEQKALDLGLSDMSTPKDLESALHVNDHYDMFISFGSKNRHEGTPYEVIRKEVLAQLQRLNISTNQSVKEKYATANKAFLAAEKIVSESKEMNDIEKAIYLFERMQPAFAINTGCGVRNRSASALEASRRSLGLFESVMNKYKRTLARESTPVEDAVKEHKYSLSL